MNDYFLNLLTENGITLEIVGIRGWGQIQYLDTPEKRQDEIGHMVAEILNLMAEK